MIVRLIVLLCLTFVSGYARPGVGLPTSINGDPAARTTSQPGVARPKYWILLDSKDQSTAPALSAAALARRYEQALSVDDTDRPVSGAYLKQLQQIGVEPVCQSRWLNAVSARLTTEQYAQVSTLPFVKSIVTIDPAIIITSLTHPAKSDEVNPMLAPVMTQIQAPDFAKAGLTGRFVTIGVIDAGFFGADSVSALKHIFAREGVNQVRDYVNDKKTHGQLFRTLETMSDFHGTEVLAAIAGNDPGENVQYGLATDAKFYLARTDQGNREYRGEEDNWVAAMEWMDSLGVRLINTSLGYAKGMSNPKDNYAPSQMDGHTSLISRAAQIAADKKGILVIVSAGNEGEDRSWRIISTPADAQGVLAIGATNSKLWNRIGYSSIGPESLPYLKPNVSCFSLYGTSLSAPVITGFAACVMQANPKLTNKEVMELIEKSSHLYPYGNNYVGYGVPQASRAIALLKNQPMPATSRLVKAPGKTVTVPVTTPETTASIFHKKDATHVIQQEAAKVTNGQLTLRRATGEKQTTIDLKQEVIEVIWE
ncbi:S8 family serine peptidase [Spirosoma utsteinense]|uniref:Subtilisin family serine protease n=1 Tax=Spirosoma utsteinense TaxID=2585773 RepID=A0ABR6VZS5_9BACT|nr:S8 family serine peptidase [Spirosoma utsteinense]MBC3786857.1 subtilisin family serine protease [Spirosoma utsteinense]MBC3789847.1 subtilisin family serine protease [Spirosoma utsteinense]